MTVTFQVSLPLRLQRSQVLPRLGQAYDDFLFSRISPFETAWHQAGFLKLSTNVGPVLFGFVCLLINFNPPRMDTFVKYNQNDLPEKNEMKRKYEL